MSLFEALRPLRLGGLRGGHVFRVPIRLHRHDPVNRYFRTIVAHWLYECVRSSGRRIGGMWGILRWHKGFPLRISLAPLLRKQVQRFLVPGSSPYFFRRGLGLPIGLVEARLR